MTHHDLLIIGSGSGNSIIDDSMADWDVGLVEDRMAGGTCLNYGCIPSKMLVYAADVNDVATSAPRFNVDAHSSGVQWTGLRDRVFGRTDSQSAAGLKGREDSDFVTVYRGRAEFTGAKSLTIVDSEEGRRDVTADRIVLANGGRPAIPPVVQDCGLPYETSDTIMRIDAPPSRLAILGGGYIAAELAHVFAAAGSHITIIGNTDHLLGGPQDGEIRAAFTDLMGERYELRLGTEVSRIDGRPGDLHLTLDDGGVVDADMLLVATGRTPNSDRLNLAVTSVDVADDGRIVVDEFCRTTESGVFALGDVSSPIPLKHVANREAEIVAHNLRHPDQLRAVDHDRVPSAVFADPQMASVGLTEEKCREEHPDYLVGRTSYGDVAYGWALQDDTGFCKVLVDRASHRILGAHLMGPQAASLIQIFVVAMEFGVTADELARRPYWIHPALTEVVENALLDVGAPA